MMVGQTVVDLVSSYGAGMDARLDDLPASPTGKSRVTAAHRQSAIDVEPMAAAKDEDARCRSRSASCPYDAQSGASWLADDPELLRVALEIVDSWDDAEAKDQVTVAWSSGVEVDGIAPTEGNPVDETPINSRSQADKASSEAGLSENGDSRELKPSTVASTHYKRNEEIAYLRKKKKELEQQLATLLPKMQKKPSSEAPGGGGDGNTLTEMWREVAACQLQRLQRAKLDQAKLRHSLETQMTVSKDLMTLMKRVRHLNEHDVCATRKRARVGRELSLEMDAGSQLEQIDQMYQELETLFTFSKFHDGTTNFVDISVTDKEDTVVIEFCEAWALPFDADRVLEALWEYNRKRVDPSAVPVNHVMNTTASPDGDLVVCQCTVVSTEKGLEATGEGQLILRRYQGDRDRPPAIFIAMDTRPSQANPGDLRGMLNRGVSCIRVVPLQKERPYPTQVQISQRVAIKCESTSRANAGSISDFVLKRIKSDIYLKHEMIESILLRPPTHSA